MRRSLLALMGLGLLAAAGCVSDDEGGDSFTLTGAISNVASGPVPAGTVTIRLEEQGVMDVAAKLIAETSVVSDGKAARVPFVLQVPKPELDKAVDAGFTIRVERDGRLIATNTSKQRYSGGSNVSLRIEPILY
ncbi:MULTISPECIES: YbaY family lipoprotein [unclassified Ensifer]|uniref:YbaY family lipoprotein n=1 Tax=unclassified Ensifer TaxID=2633371 RepID=UPI0013747E76|nr:MULTISPECIES: YbaY family lipoprotein [unclassified Ensifer]